MQTPAKLVNYSINTRQVFVDALNGSDTAEPGRGGKLQPYQTIEAALLDIVGRAAGNYTLVLAPGAYGSAPIAWPVSAGKNISVLGSGDAAIVQPITYTAIGGAVEESVVFQNVGINDITIDLAAAAAKVAQLLFANCSLKASRIDSLPPGPQVVRIFDSFITSLSTNATMIVVNGEWIGGAPNAIGATGNMVCQSSLTAAMTYNVDPGGQLVLQGCIASFSTFNIDGTLTMLDVVAPGATIGGAGALISDAASFAFGPTVTVPSVTLADNAERVGFSPAIPGDWAVPPTQVKQALDELAAATAPSANPKIQLVFQPGGVAGGNIYTTWASLMAAVSSVAGPKSIFFDDSIVSPCVIPAGAYALEEVTFDAAIKGKITSVQVDNGVTWTGLRVIKNLNINFLTTAFVEVLPAVGIILEGATITANGSGAIWSVPAGAQFQLSRGSAFQGVGGISAVADLASGQVIQLVLATVSSVDANSISSPAADPTAVLTVLRPDETGGFTAQGAQFGGTTSDVPLQNANKLFFSPTTPADWITPPTEVAGGLDELASRVNGAAKSSTFVFQDGGVSSGNVYASWAALYAALSLVKGPKIVQIDDSVTSPCVIPAGTYDMTDVTLVAASGVYSASPRLSLADLCVLDNLAAVAGGLGVESQSTAPVLAYTTGQRKLEVRDLAYIRGILAGVPFIDISGTAIIGVLVTELASLGLKSINVTGTGQAQILLFNQSTIQTDALESDATGAISVGYDATSQYSATQSAWANPQPFNRLDDVERVQYNPSTPGNYITAPSQGRAALDTLAERQPTVFVYQEGGTTGKNVYATWAELIAAMAVAGASEKKIVIDNTFVTPCVIPAGAHNLLNCEIVGNGQQSAVEFADGATVTGLKGFGNNLNVTSVSSSPVITTGGSYSTIAIRQSCTIRALGSAPFFSVPNLTALYLELDGFSIALDGPTDPVVYVDAGGTLNAVAIGGAYFQSASIDGVGTLNVSRMGRNTKYTRTLDAGDIVNQYIDLPDLINEDSLQIAWNYGLPVLETDDYTLSTVGGVTRLTFVPGGLLATFAAAGQKVQNKYLY